MDVLADDNAGTLTKYLNGLGIDDKLRVQTGSSVNYFLTDHLGSTNGLANSSGSVTSSTAYDSFGNATNSTFPSRYQYTGREFDSFTGLHYYRARFYDANLGRFTSEDPIGFRGGDVNLFGYVKNSPLNFVDPSGNQGVGYSDLMADYRAKQKAKQCEDTCQRSMPPIPHHDSGWNVNDNIREAGRRFPNSNWFYDQVKNDAPWDYKRKGQYFNGRSEYEEFGNFNYGATCKAWGFTSYMCRNEAGLAQDPNDDLDPGKGEAGRRISYLFDGWLFGGWGDYGDDDSDQVCINQGISYFEAFDEKRRCGCEPR